MMLENILLGGLLVVGAVLIASFPWIVVGAAICECYSGTPSGEGGMLGFAAIICAFFCLFELAMFFDWLFKLGPSVLG